MTDERYPLALPQGSILAGQYIIEQVLGQGGFGITYKARDHKSGLEVAIKEFFPDSMATRTQTAVTAFVGERAESFAYGKACFLQEAETLAEFIGNENIVRVHSYFEENQTAYFVMDFVEGTSFDRYIKEHGGRVSYEEAEKILLPVIDALAEVHRRGIVHRDVTPDNIYITSDGTVKLLDFGAARYSLGDKSRSLDVVLKHGFAPKEQYTRRGKQGAFTDVYTLGASFYFAITGRRPPDSIDRMEEDELIPPGNLGVSIPEGKEEAILKAMSVQPSERFQSMEAFKQALVGNSAPAQQPTPVEQYERSILQPKPVDMPEQPSVFQPEKKKPFLWAGIGAGAVTVIVIIAVAAFFGNKTKPAANADDDKPVHYDTAEELVINSETESIPESVTESVTEPEPEISFSGSDVEILGNTPNNIAQKGKCVCDQYLFTAMPGSNGLLGFDLSDNAYMVEEDGGISCISNVGEQIYYLRNGRAYCANVDGTDKVKLQELEDFGYIDSFYVSKEYYYIFQKNTARLQCVERNTGEIKGSLSVDEPEFFTFLNGYLYYVTGDNVKRLWRIPADNFGAEAEQILGPDDNIYNCYEIIGEGDYLYGVYKVTDTNAVHIFQYDTVKNGIVSRYEFTREAWPGSIDSLNVSSQYVYFVFYDTTKYVDIVYRFKADENKDSFEIQPVYEGVKDVSFLYLLTLEKNQSVVVYGFRKGGMEVLIRMNMDGSGEATVIDEEMYR